MPRKLMLRHTDSEELTEYMAWMIIQREDQQGAQPGRAASNSTDEVDKQLMKIFGGPR